MGEEVCREVRPEAELRRWNENPRDSADKARSLLTPRWGPQLPVG